MTIYKSPYYKSAGWIHTSYYALSVEYVIFNKKTLYFIQFLIIVLKDILPNIAMQIIYSLKKIFVLNLNEIKSLKK